MWKNTTRWHSNETSREMEDVQKIEEFLRKQKLQWFRLIKKIEKEKTPVKAKSFEVDGSKRGRLKKRLKKAVEKFLLVRGSKK